MKKILLASNSPRRRELLSQAGIDFEVKVSDVDENIGETDPEELVKKLSRLKAGAVYGNNKDRTVIGADTVVSIDGRILGKPTDKDDAFAMLRMLSGKTHQVFTGVTIFFPGEEPDAEPEIKTFAEKTDVTFYELTDEEIENYIETGEPMDKAGAYAIQGKGAVLVEKISGDYNTVVGLPLARTVRAV